jgi:D-sedoheptulose 7-phosphate isomerase
MSPESTDFLYPFIERGERDVAGLLTALAESARAKAIASAHLARTTLDACDALIDVVAGGIGRRLRSGGRLFTFGNGGSATDAGMAASLFADPPVGQAFPAHCLVSDVAVLTALSNDIGFDAVFSRQLIAHGRAGDVALGFSTSGNSDNLLRAFADARRLELLTVGVSGYDGGAMVRSSDVDHCLVVHSDSVHRVQEVQAALVVEVWSRVQRLVGALTA